MVRNQLTDLNNHLFEQLERLNDSELTEADLVLESQRTRLMSVVAGEIIRTQTTALKMVDTLSVIKDSVSVPTMLEGDGGDD